MPEFKHTPDSLANQLDQRVPPHSHGTGPSDGDPLVEAARQMAEVPYPTLSASARLRIQSQVLQHASQQPPVHRIRPTWTPIVRWALAASLALLILLVPAARVTLASVPGDAFYPVKQAVEQAEIALANSAESRAALSLTHAERRTHEAQVLLGRGIFDPAILTAAYGSLDTAATMMQSDTNFDEPLKSRLETQSTALTREIANLLDTASQPDNPVALTAIPFVTAVAATDQANQLGAPADPTETPTPSASPAPSDVPSETPTATTTATPTETPTQTETPLPTETPTPTLEVNLVIEGPIESIVGNIVTIYGIEIVFNETDPLLPVLRKGDVIRVNGNIAESTDETVTITNIETQPADDSLSLSEDGGTVWRDTGDCSNPPPSWAPANGWRTRCEGQAAPGNSGGNNGNSQSQSNASVSPDDQSPGQSGSAPGQQDNPGQGNANGKSKDKDKEKDKDD